MTLTADRRAELIGGCRAVRGSRRRRTSRRSPTRAIEVEFPADRVIARAGRDRDRVLHRRRRPGAGRPDGTTVATSVRASSSASCRCSTADRASRRSWRRRRPRCLAIASWDFERVLREQPRVAARRPPRRRRPAPRGDHGPPDLTARDRDRRRAHHRARRHCPRAPSRSCSPTSRAPRAASPSWATRRWGRCSRSHRAADPRPRRRRGRRRVRHRGRRALRRLPDRGRRHPRGGRGPARARRAPVAGRRRSASGWASTPARRSSIAGDYVGIDVHRAARIAVGGARRPGRRVRRHPRPRRRRRPTGSTLRDLGEHRLKDLPRPERAVPGRGAGPRARLPAAAVARRDAQQPAAAAHLVRRAGRGRRGGRPARRGRGC